MPLPTLLVLSLNLVVFIPKCLVLQLFFQNLVFHQHVLPLQTAFVIRNILNQISKHYFVLMQIIVFLPCIYEIIAFVNQLPKNHLKQIVKFIYLQIHVFSETMKLWHPLNRTFRIFILSDGLFELLKLFFHILGKIFEVFGHFDWKYVFE